MKLTEHKSSSYAPRTYHNASQGVTLAVAVDFTTAGEKLTKKASTKGFVSVPYRLDYIHGARELYKMLRHKGCHVLNVAGNGIYTFKNHGVSQYEVNQYIYNIISLVSEHWHIEKIVSGGQSGADIAGLVCAKALGIEFEGTWPKGFKMRFEDGIDVNMTEEAIVEIINDGVLHLEINK